ncbi:MAG: cobyrinic acid a,c-diamide synthase [Blastocatellia bacterium]|jgi:cobyrinic acid a,c-diamide synthase|nr:cobyrinic acid a,c-diamide synthase [Blastocatellia bacterium]
MLPPALVIAGTHSGVGKTTISIALMAALRRRGLRVQPFKVGPDFIDPTLHTRAACRISRNLDGWMLEPAANLRTFTRFSIDADFSVVEGVMGLFDGRDALTDKGSTAEMSKLLDLPVLLVVDASAMARSAAAIVHGYESFDQELDVAGIIFNRVASAGHFAYLRESVEATCRARVLGWLSTDESVALPERHLGLFMPNEVLNDARFDALVSWIERGVDIDELIRLARERSERQAVVESQPVEIENTALQEDQPFDRRPRIGIARDSAFCFYYQDNLDLLVNAGAEIVEFSPIKQERLPESLDGLYLGGGYPELYAAALAANETMRDDVARFAQSGKPVYGECGGLMYLTEAIVDQESHSFPMVGVFPTRARMQPRLAALGYAEVEGMNKTGWLRPDERARGHEFRYSVIDDMPEQIQRCYRVSTMAGERQDGFSVGSVLGSYVHLHFGSCPRFAARFVAACAGR